MFEALEGRRLYASVHTQPAFSVDKHGTLRISGSGGDDTIAIGIKNGDVRLDLNGRQLVLTRSVRRAVIYGGDGNDVINGSVGGHFADFSPFPFYIDGGSGNDTLTGSNHGDTIYGGDGNDVLSGYWNTNLPPVYLDGGPGDDTLTDGTVIHGGAGNDVATNDDSFARSIFTSGLEKFVDAHNSAIAPVVVPPSDYVSTLSTRNGRLAISYLPNTHEVHQLLAPYVRSDGRIGITVTYDYPTAGATTPHDRMFVTLSEGYTARALKKGIVLTFSGPAAGRTTEWPILLPQTT